MAVAETTTQRQRGLRNVESLGGLDGMLFVFEDPRTATFGMRDTHIPLDIWWFDGSGTLVGTTTMTPCPEEPCADYPSPGEIRWALETPAGEFDFAVGVTISTAENP